MSQIRSIILLSLLLAVAGRAAAAEVPILSGGIGESGREELAARQSEFSLKLVFAYASGSYLASVAVRIADAASGEVLVDAVSNGPWFLADLPAGRYRVTATYEGESQSADVSVPAQGLREVTLRWQAPPE